MRTKREPGFYWVNDQGGWTVGRYTPPRDADHQGTWEIVGNDEDLYYDEEFVIDERQILRNEDNG